MARLTVADLALIVAEQGKTLGSLTTGVEAILAQFNTPTAVVEVVTPKPAKAKKAKADAPVIQLPTQAAAPVVQPVAPVVKTTPASVAGDTLKAFVESKGLAFAQGGRTYLDTDDLAAIARVLKTGTSEIVTTKREALVKRGVVAIAIGLSGDGGVITQFVFDPSKTRN